MPQLCVRQNQQNHCGEKQNKISTLCAQKTLVVSVQVAHPLFMHADSNLFKYVD